jgi:hypothetical protein
MNFPESPDAPMTPEQMHSALFANLVIQNSQMALLFLGKMPHPETGEIVRDLEGAQSYIDFLDMLEQKTKGNLDAREQAMLQQSLTNLRLAFVAEMKAAGLDVPEQYKPRATTALSPQSTKSISEPPANQPAAAAVQPAPAATPPASTISPNEPEESRKRFTKKY